MRSIIALSIAALFVLAGCRGSRSEVITGSAGEAFEEARQITAIKILPVHLPDDIHGWMSDEERKRYTRDWPMAGARMIAAGVNDEARRHVIAMATLDEPKSGYYFDLRITYLDVGDPEIRRHRGFYSRGAGWTHVLATGWIMNADTDEMVARLEFSQSSGWGRYPPFETDMFRLGRELGDWLKEQR